ncbi:hypothetical protein JCM8097_004272 [Rhodosporidiobolus ruineniae]
MLSPDSRTAYFKKRLAPANKQDAYYAHFAPAEQQEPSSGGHGYGQPPQQHYQQQQLTGAPNLPPGAGLGSGPPPSSNFAGVGASGRRGAPMSVAGAYPGILGGAAFDPRARDGGWAAAGGAEQQQQYAPQPQQQQQQQYPPYPYGGAYSPSPPPRTDSRSPPSNLPPSIAYNPPHSSFRGPTDLAQDAQLAPPSSNRFGNAPQGSQSPTPSYRSIPALGAIPRQDSDSGVGSQVGQQGRLRVVNEEADPYGGLDEGLRR